MKEFLKKIIEIVLPNKFQLHLRYLYLKLFNKLDPEMFYVSSLLKDRRRFLDIGANIGIYSFYFRNIFKNIEAFEPLDEITYRLKSLSSSHISIHNIALSNKMGHVNLNIPIINGVSIPARASIDIKKSENIERAVEIRSVDSYGFDDIDLIKIDVEGHEESVIIGAQNTIKKSMPIIIAEIQQRHIKKKISEVFETILNMNYNGFFIYEGELMSIDNFEYEVHQKSILQDTKSKKYIENFIFIPRER
jgi:FkbM family methyltransferase